jgi:hypothetical protein
VGFSENLAPIYKITTRQISEYRSLNNGKYCFFFTIVNRVVFSRDFTNKSM